jgi:hypothetical protein
VTIKEKVQGFRKLAADRARLAAKYAKSKDYEQAAKWYYAASNYTKIANTLANPKSL